VWAISCPLLEVLLGYFAWQSFNQDTYPGDSSISQI